MFLAGCSWQGAHGKTRTKYRCFAPDGPAWAYRVRMTVPVQSVRHPLATLWATTVGVAGGSASGLAGHELEEAYAAPDRVYHSTGHPLRVAYDAAVLGRSLRLDQDDRIAVMLAALAHDVVYRGSPDDEELSAEWAVSALSSAGVPRGLVARVRGLVLVTAAHVVPAGDGAAATLSDADLAVLGAGTATYERYRAGVRHEFARFDDAAWACGRAAVLRRLLARPGMFVSPAGRAKWEVRARENLTAELAGFSLWPGLLPVR